MARLALDYSDEAVTGLQSLVNEYDTRKSGIWSDVKMVMRKGKFEKHLGRIEKAKGVSWYHVCGSPLLSYLRLAPIDSI
jgi:hypothetical protein